MKFSCSNLYKQYNKNEILDGFTYAFEPGLYLIIGKNGIGKSTLLKTLCTIIKPSNTNYKLDKIKTAYLCEKIELLSSKVLPFLRSVAKINKVKYDIEKEMLVWNLPNKNILNLSKGNKQKLGILMLMLTEADMYILDEPTNALDELSINLLKYYLKRLLEKGKIVLISTHSKSVFDNFNYKEITL